jgi:hypothetical protein
MYSPISLKFSAAKERQILRNEEQVELNAELIPRGDVTDSRDSIHDGRIQMLLLDLVKSRSQQDRSPISKPPQQHVPREVVSNGTRGVGDVAWQLPDDLQNHAIVLLDLIQRGRRLKLKDRCVHDRRCSSQLAVRYQGGVERFACHAGRESFRRGCQVLY